MVHFTEGIPEEHGLEGYFHSYGRWISTDSTQLEELPENTMVSDAYQGMGDTIFENIEIVLKFKSSTTTEQINNTVSTYELELIEEGVVYDRYKSVNALVVAQQIFETGLVAYAHPNFFAPIKPAHNPNDVYFDKQWYLHNTGQIVNDGLGGLADADMDVPEAWDITKGDSNVVTAIIDWGVEANHLDLPISRQLRLPGGNVAAIYDTTLSPNDVSTDPSFPHGTNCAGIVAATQDNAIGISGIAPKTKIMPVRIGSGLGVSVVADAIAFADTNNANILSASFMLGHLKFSVIEDAIKLALKNNKS
jgi:subtilisin family serine protease